MSCYTREDFMSHPYCSFNKVMSLLDYQDPLSLSPILRAVLLDDIQKVQELIIAGNSAHITDNNGNCALHLAVLKQSDQMLEFLLQQKKIRIDYRNYTGHTPLLLAVENNCKRSIIDILINAKCDLNIKTNFNEFVLHLAISNSTLEIIHLLIKNGADINAQDGSLYTPLHDAVTRNDLALVSMLIYYGADTGKICYNGLTPFMHSMLIEDASEITDILLLCSDTFPHTSSRRESALDIAIRCNKSDIVLYIIKGGGYRMEDISKALRYAMEKSDMDLFKIIINDLPDECDERFDFPAVWRYLFYIYTSISSICLQFFYLLVEVGLKHKCYNIHPLNETLVDLLKFLHRSGENSDEKGPMLWAFLSLGVVVEANDIFECFKNFRTGIEAEILYRCYNPQLCFNPTVPQCLPMAYFDLMFKIDNFWDFKLELDKLCLEFNNPKLSYYYKRFPTPYFGDTTHTLNNLDQSRIPFLIEFSRNAAALYIVSALKLEHPYQFFDAVRNLEIPRFYKEVLTLAVPVYKNSRLYFNL